MQKQCKQPRRVDRVTVERGIYYRERAKGLRYEIGFPASDGGWRTQVVAGGLKEARQARAEMVARLGRGEKVAASRRTFAELAEAWLAHKDGLGRRRLRPRTRERYEQVIVHHLLPQLGRRRGSQLSREDVENVMAAMRRAGKAEGTVLKALNVLNAILGHGVSRGWIAANPVRELERDERPSAERGEMRILNRDEIEALLAGASPRYRSLLATAIFTGLRHGELLGLTWADVDFEAGLVRVRKQLERPKAGERPQRVEPKTRQAIRAVELMPTLATFLREHKEQAFARGFARPEDFVFATDVGTPLAQRNVLRRALDPAVKRAGLDRVPKLRFHDLRHTFASLLISGGLPVSFVSCQLGHANPAITLTTYTHLFDREEHGKRARAALEDFGPALGRVWAGKGGNGREIEPPMTEAKVARIEGFRNGRERTGTAALP